jgi:hypothetical protein
MPAISVNKLDKKTIIGKRGPRRRIGTKVR